MFGMHACTSAADVPGVVRSLECCLLQRATDIFTPTCFQPGPIRHHTRGHQGLLPVRRFEQFVRVAPQCIECDLRTRVAPVPSPNRSIQSRLRRRW